MKRPSILDRVKPAVRAIAPYTLRNHEYELKMNQNENPYDVPAPVKREILDFAMQRSWSRYPPFVPDDLHAALAEYAGWRADGVLAGNGSNEIIGAVMNVLLRPGGKLVLPTPTFTVYGIIAAVVGGSVETVPLRPDLFFDCDAVEAAVADGADMVIICSPNNPTGALYPADRLETLLRSTGIPVVVDEAYYEFARETVVPLLAEYDNLIVLRTFSKAFSLAGLRVGYGLMDPALAREVDKAKLPYNIDFLSITAAMKLLENRDLMEGTIDELIGERERMLGELAGLDDVTVYPSRANFFIIETPYPPGDVFRGLLDDGILVRDVSSYPMLGRALRVSVSRPGDNDRFLLSLKRVLAELKTTR